MRPVVSLRASALRLVSCACSASSAHARLIPASVLIASARASSVARSVQAAGKLPAGLSSAQR